MVGRSEPSPSARGSPGTFRAGIDWVTVAREVPYQSRVSSGRSGLVRNRPYSMGMSAEFSVVDLLSLFVGVASLAFTVAIFALGRKLTFRERRRRVRELEKKAWKVLGPIRTRGLNSKVIIMNVARYERGYDGSNEPTWRGNAYEGHEIIEIVHGGVEVIVMAVETWYDQQGRRSLTKSECRAPNALYVGHIPWDWIEDIAPRGDEFDGSAIFFVRYRAPGRRPFDYVTYREGISVLIGPNERPYYKPIPELGTRRPSWSRDWRMFIAGIRTERKMAKARMRRASRHTSVTGFGAESET